MSLFALLFAGALFAPLIKQIHLLKTFALVVLMGTGVSLILGNGVDLNYFAQTDVVRFFEGIVLVVAGAIVLHLDAKEESTVYQLLFITAASMLLLESSSLLSFIISFEAIAIISFVLVSNIKDAKQAEGAMKLFFAGATASGVLLFGLALFTFSGHAINDNLAQVKDPFSLIALGIIFIGILYKLTVFPMHQWSADSYAYVSHTHAAILSGLIKTVAVVAAFNIFSPLLMSIEMPSIYALAILAVITMTLGNILALYQKNIARMLAYSSIAHAGYMLIPFAAAHSHFAPVGMLYLAVAYIFMQSAVFLILSQLYKTQGISTLADMKGLGQNNPLIAVLFTIQLLSLAGIPLLAGFISKATAFYAGVDAGLWPVILIALLNSALSVGYYAWMIKKMYFDPPKSAYHDVNPLSFVIGELILATGTIYFGIVAIDIWSVG